ncbi:MAG: hypothetical protein M1838_006280 [Thelocarpon superellum]|nr:MAG: hypothetical protein M1838_006280 [Thelocarpon superellum]
MASSPRGNDPVIAFFGATGGCTSTVLAQSLRAGYHCTALVRDASKLTKILNDLDVPHDVQSGCLTVTTGNVTDIHAVKATLRPSITGPVVRTIVSGVRGALKFSGNPLAPVTSADPRVCQDTITTILRALGAVLPTSTAPLFKPTIIALSTAGISRLGRDMPILMMPLYHWLLAVPLADNRAMETVLENTAQESSSLIRETIVIRPSLLVGGAAKGLAKIRVGWEEDGGKPAIGYTVSRADVGKWIFEECLISGGKGVVDEPRWEGKHISLTY